MTTVEKKNQSDQRFAMPLRSSRASEVAHGAAAAVTNAAPDKAIAPKRHRARDPEDFKTSTLQIRVKSDVKDEASKVLEKIGISLPEAVRVFLGRIAREQSFPFLLEVPNAETAEALGESLASERKRYSSVAEMFDDLEKGSVL